METVAAHVKIAAAGNYEPGTTMAVDIGGTMCKCCIGVVDNNGSILQSLFALSSELKESPRTIAFSGGGAVKFHDSIVSEFGQSALFVDEVAALRGGLTVSARLAQKAQVEYPLLLVSLGTGVSFIKVSSADSATRVGGTCIGGGTFAGLASSMFPGRRLEDLLQIAAAGDAGLVDCLVGDIYGRSYDIGGLDADLPASSLCKAASYNGDNFEADFCRALARMLCVNTAQLATLYALKERVHSVAFTGTLCHLGLVRDEMQKAFDYWAKGNDLNIRFCEFPAYTCALGGLDLLQCHNMRSK